MNRWVRCVLAQIKELTWIHAQGQQQPEQEKQLLAQYALQVACLGIDVNSAVCVPRAEALMSTVSGRTNATHLALSRSKLPRTPRTPRRLTLLINSMAPLQYSHV